MRATLILAMLFPATPAAAQFVAAPTPPRGAAPPISGSLVDPERDLERARGRIERARADQRLSRREARRYRREADAIGALGERLGSDGLSAGERQELDMRARVLADQAALAGRNEPARK